MLPSFASMIPLTTFVWPAIALAVLEALAIDPRRRLHLVRCDERTVLLLTGGAEDLVVGWLPEARP